MSIENKDLGLMDIVEQCDIEEQKFNEQAFMQTLIQLLGVENLPVRPATCFNGFFGEHPSMFGEEVHWFEPTYGSGNIDLIECKPNLKGSISGDELVDFESLAVCLAKREGSNAFMVTYHGLLFLFSESTGYKVDINDMEVKLMNITGDGDITYNLQYNVEGQSENEQLHKAQFMVNLLDNLSVFDYIIESSDVYYDGVGRKLSDFPLNGKWYKAGRDTETLVETKPTLLKPGIVDCMQLQLYVGEIDNKTTMLVIYSGVLYKLVSGTNFNIKVSDNKIVVQSGEGFIKYNLAR